MLTQEQDQQLVERVQRGDKRAFDLLVLKYQHKILGLIVRFVHDSHEAQDVAQEAFIKAYRALANFRGDSAFYTWLYRIAINTAKNHLVARGRRPPDSDVSSEDAEFYEGDHALKDIESPERALLRDEIEDTVHRTIQQLPEDLRTALTLREFDGLSYEDIAKNSEVKTLSPEWAISIPENPILRASSTRARALGPKILILAPFGWR